MQNIQLQAAGLNQWLDEMEKRITHAKDTADMIETEAQSLKKIWEGEAEKVWQDGLSHRIEEAKIQLAEMSRIAADVGKAGKSLADMEMGLIAEAKKR